MSKKVNQKKYHIKAGDTVYVNTGKEKGRTGKVRTILTDKDRAIVENLNMVKRHSRPTQKNPAGGITEKELGIHVSNLMLYDNDKKEPVKVGYKIKDDGKKVRINRKTGEEV